MTYSEFTFQKLENDLQLTINEYYTPPGIYGVVTTGSSWKFIQLQENVITIDTIEYFIGNIGKVMGILFYMINQDMT